LANLTVFTLQFMSNYNSVSSSFLPFPLCLSLSFYLVGDPTITYLLFIQFSLKQKGIMGCLTID